MCNFLKMFEIDDSRLSPEKVESIVKDINYVKTDLIIHLINTSMEGSKVSNCKFRLINIEEGIRVKISINGKCKENAFYSNQRITSMVSKGNMKYMRLWDVLYAMRKDDRKVEEVDIICENLDKTYIFSIHNMDKSYVSTIVVGGQLYYV